jgi:hypothetical protein
MAEAAGACALRSPPHACSTHGQSGLLSSFCPFGSPSEPPRPLSPSLPSCRSSQAPSVFDYSNLVSDDEVPIPCSNIPSPLRPPRLQIVMMKFSFRSALVSRDSDDGVLIPSPLTRALILPCRLVAVANALLGIGYGQYRYASLPSTEPPESQTSKTEENRKK